jgi:hypothetical protein
VNTGGDRRSFLSGGELRGLIVFAVVMAIGWPVILSYARPKDRKPEPPPAVDSRPLEPDTGIAFDRLLDKAPMSGRDNPAYKILLDRTRNTPPAALAKQARRDVMYTQLWERPDLYRGVPIHLEGTLRKTLAHEKMNPELVPKGRAIECWFFTRESNQLPYVVMVEEPPPGLVVGTDLSESVVVDAYFLRLLGYTAGDHARAAPLFVGRLRWASADPKTGAPADTSPASKRSWTSTVFVVAAMLGLYVTARLFFSIRKRRTPIVGKQPCPHDDRPVEHIAPDDLANFLASVPDEDEEEKPAG